MRHFEEIFGHSYFARLKRKLTFVVSNCGKSTTRPPALRGDMRESTIPKGLYKLIECKSEEDSSNSQKFRTRFISRFKSLCLSSNFCGFSPVNWNKWKELANSFFAFAYQASRASWLVCSWDRASRQKSMMEKVPHLQCQYLCVQRDLDLDKWQSFQSSGKLLQP